MTRSREEQRITRSGSATQVLDDDSITAIIPLDELEARLGATYAESWVDEDWATDADQGGRALDFRPTRSELTQDLLIPEDLFTGTRPAEVPVADEDDDAPSAFVIEPETAPDLPLTTAPVRKGGRHRVAAPPHALKGRAALLALAAGASVAGAAVAVTTDSPTTAQQPITPPVGSPDLGAARQAPLPAPQDMGQFAGALAAGKDRKAADDQIVIDSLRPKVTAPINGATLTSNFGTRWGAMHGGLDLAAPLGTPLFAVSDGVITDAGPAQGFGIWIKIKLSDGTVLVYGHMYNVNVQVGQQVKAGDLVSWVGNNGFSTGPHLHFEVHTPDGAKIDPQGWLAERGIRV